MKKLKIVPIFYKYDYGKIERGESIEKLFFLTALKSITNEVIPFWLEDNGFPNDKKELQKKMIDFVNRVNPDIIFFVLIRNEISIETIEYLSKKYITVNWFCDDQWRFETFTKYIAPKFTYSITVDKYSIHKYKSIGYSNVILSQWATTKIIKDIDFNNIIYKYDITFIGGKNLVREWYINSLKKAEYNVTCFGYGWKNGKVSYDEMNDIFLHSKINLNLSNSIPFDLRFRKFLFFSFIKSLFSFKKIKTSTALRQIRNYLRINNNSKRVEQIKMRNFEIPACGGFQLSHFVLTLEDNFNIGKEIAVFNNIDELKKQIDFYLENTEMREEIRTNGYYKSQQYTFEKRFEAIFKEIKL